MKCTIAELQLTQAQDGYNIETSLKIKMRCYKLIPFPVNLFIGFDSKLQSIASTYPPKECWNISVVFNSENPTAGTMAHEASHVIDELGEYIGSELELEVKAYYLGFVVDCMCDAIKKQAKVKF